MAQLQTSLSHFRKQPLRSDDRLAFLIIHKWGENKTFVAISCIIWSVSNRTTFTAMFNFPLIAHLPTSLMQNVIMAKFFYQYSWQMWNHVWKLCVVILKDRANIAAMAIASSAEVRSTRTDICEDSIVRGSSEHSSALQPWTIEIREAVPETVHNEQWR